METGLNYNNNNPGLYEITLPMKAVVSVNDNINVPEKFELSQNFPNPFNPTTKINFSLPKTMEVSLIVTNTLGQIVAEPVTNHVYSNGKHSVIFDGKNLSSGIYIYTIEAGNFKKSRSMVLLK